MGPREACDAESERLGKENERRRQDPLRDSDGNDMKKLLDPNSKRNYVFFYLFNSFYIVSWRYSNPAKKS